MSAFRWLCTILLVFNIVLAILCWGKQRTLTAIIYGVFAVGWLVAIFIEVWFT